MIKFYRVDADDTLLVHDTKLGLYAPFTLHKRCPLTLSNLFDWWGDECVDDYRITTPEEIEEYKALGMVQIGGCND